MIGEKEKIYILVTPHTTTTQKDATLSRAIYLLTVPSPLISEETHYISTQGATLFHPRTHS